MNILDFDIKATLTFDLSDYLDDAGQLTVTTDEARFIAGGLIREADDLDADVADLREALEEEPE